MVFKRFSLHDESIGIEDTQMGYLHASLSAWYEKKIGN